MTPFKELKRIENAIESGSESDLGWALAYCLMRVKVAGQVATMKRQGKYWRDMEQKVRAALLEAKANHHG